MPGAGCARRAVPVYDAFHTLTVPVALWVAGVSAGLAPWPLLGWPIHIAAERALGFGLLGPDGGQALI